MNRRFTALRVIGTFMKVLAWIALILGFLSSVLLLILGLTLQEPLGIIDLELGGALAGVVGFVLVLVSSVTAFLFLYAGGDFVYVLLSLEDSARRMAYFSQETFRFEQRAYAANASDAPFPADSDD